MKDSLKITWRETESLIPYGRNQKKHDEKQIRNVANSIKRFGWQQPIVIDKNDVVVIGHCRLKAAQMLKLEEVPVTVADDLSEDEIRELRIIDNKTNESEWDLDNLDIDLNELDFEGFDLDFNFDLPSNSEEHDEDSSDEKDEAVERLVNEAWKEYANEYCKQYDVMQKQGFTFSGLTKSLAKIKFIESKFYGKEYPRYLSVAFHPQQFITNGDNCSAYEGLKKVAEGKIKVERLRFVVADDLSKIFKGSLSFSGARMPLDFPASLAKSLIDEFGHNGRILDPCHGWGGD